MLVSVVTLVAEKVSVEPETSVAVARYEETGQTVVERAMTDVW